jgi:prophage maintenance system killer protein
MSTSASEVAASKTTTHTGANELATKTATAKAAPTPPVDDSTTSKASAVATSGAAVATTASSNAGSSADTKQAHEVQATARTNANKPAKKFPKYITDNLVFEEAPASADLKEKAAYEEAQKQDYLKALRYIEAELLTIAPKAWTVKKIIKVLKDLYKITCSTLLTHKLNNLDNETFSGFRTSEVHTIKGNPPQTPGVVLKNYRYNIHSIDKVAEVFHILAAGYDRDVALNFIKWYIKWMRFSAQDLQKLDSLLDDKLLALSTAKMKPGSADLFASFLVFADVQKWREKNFGRLHIWLENEFSQKPQFRFPEGYLDATFLPLRANQPGLYSAEELAARDRVVKYYPLAKELPARMLAVAETLVANIKANHDPICLAAFIHREIAVVNHPCLNGNHRIARIMMNAVLVAFGYPAIDFKSEADRKAYYQASEQSEKDSQIFENFVREAVAKQVANDTCVAARDGNLPKLTKLVERLGANVDRPANPANGWTPLHYACKTGQMSTATYLVGKGANPKPQLLPGVVVTEPLEMLKKEEDKATLRKLLGNRPNSK